eukprot:g22837.t1
MQTIETWTNQTGSNVVEEDFLECMRDSLLDQYVEESTREQAILDCVLSNERGLISNIAVRDPSENSDHNMVKFFIKMESDTIKSETRVLNLKKADFDTNNLQGILGDRGSNMKEELKEVLISQVMVLRKLMGLKPD